MKKVYICSGLLAMLSLQAVQAQDFTGVKIYINPGHGGFDSDDRNMVIPPFTSGDPNGFWESQSNLDKGLQLREMLTSRNATVAMSRTLNRTEDDLPLSQIVASANQYDADFMLSIHSNAGGAANYVLQLYAGVDPGDTHTYASPTPYSDESRAITLIMAEDQVSNQANVWGNPYTVRGDKTFARINMGWSDGYGVLRGLRVPGTISEGSMHDYIPETYRLMNMDYKWLEAWHFMKTFATYFEAGAIPTGNIVGTLQDSQNENPGDFDKIRNSKDELLPLNGATVTLQPGNLTYTTDDMNNGVYVFKDLAPGTYTLRYEMEGYYAQDFTLEVAENKTTYQNVELNMVRNTPPAIETFTPNVDDSEQIICSTPLVFDFNWDVLPETAEAAFSISPAVEGVISFEKSNRQMIFTPTIGYEALTKYTVTINKTLSHADGMSMEEDFVMSFTTDDRSLLELKAAYPFEQAKGVHFDNNYFQFIFDYELDPTLVADGINVYDAQGTLLSKNARSQRTNAIGEGLGSYEFTLTKDLVEGEAYTVRIDKDLADRNKIKVGQNVELNFEVVDVKQDKGQIACNFEDADLLTVNEALSTGLSAKAMIKSTSKKLFDKAAYKVTYTFDGESGQLVGDFTPANVFKQNNHLGMHLYGDLSGNDLVLEFTSAQRSAPKSIVLTNLDFKGWEFREVALAELEADVDYTLSRIVVKQNAEATLKKGELYFDNLLFSDDVISSLDGVSAPEQVIVYDRAAKRVSVDGALDAYQSMQIFNTKGQLLLTTTKNEMSTSAMPAGIYVVRVVTKSQKLSQHIVVE